MFDVVINLEASHCYPNFTRFLAEVARVLKPGGHFLYADFRFNDGLVEWEQALVQAPFLIMSTRYINAEVLRGMNQYAKRCLNLVLRPLPRFWQALGRDFAGVKDSRIYNALQTGELSYRSYHFEKAVKPLAEL